MPLVDCDSTRKSRLFRLIRADLGYFGDFKLGHDSRLSRNDVRHRQMISRRRAMASPRREISSRCCEMASRHCEMPLGVTKSPPRVNKLRLAAEPLSLVRAQSMLCRLKSWLGVSRRMLRRLFLAQFDWPLYAGMLNSIPS